MKWAKKENKSGETKRAQTKSLVQEGQMGQRGPRPLKVNQRRLGRVTQSARHAG